MTYTKDQTRHLREAIRKLADAMTAEADPGQLVRMDAVSVPRWPAALAALEPHEQAIALIGEYAEIRESLAHAGPGQLDASDRRWKVALEGWFACNGADAEGAELDGDYDELLKLAASLRKVIDGLEAMEESEQDRGEY